MPAKKFVVPFASTGNKTAVPNTLQPDGTVSYAQGFGPDYELDKTVDPVNAKDVPRAQTNQLYYDLTDAVGEQQLYGVALWGADRAPYPINARAYHNDKLWRSSVINNSGEPGVAGWDDVSVQAIAPLPLGYFSGFTMANDGGAPNTTISVGAGAARDSTNTNNIELASALRGILQSSGAWAAGDNQNKLDTGAKANSTTYHVFAIRKTSDGTADVLFSLSATAPTMPSGYAGFRRVGRIVTDASGNIRRFKARGGGWFDWVTPISETVVVGVAPSASVMPVTGMGGVPTQVRFNAIIVADGATVRISAVDVDNPATGSDWTTYTGGQAVNVGSPSVSEGVGGEQFSEVGTAGTVNLLLYAAGGNILGAKVMSMGYKEYL